MAPYLLLLFLQGAAMLPLASSKNIFVDVTTPFNQYTKSNTTKNFKALQTIFLHHKHIYYRTGELIKELGTILTKLENFVKLTTNETWIVENATDTRILIYFVDPMGRWQVNSSTIHKLLLTPPHPWYSSVGVIIPLERLAPTTNHYHYRQPPSVQKFANAIAKSLSINLSFIIRLKETLGFKLGLDTFPPFYNTLYNDCQPFRQLVKAFEFVYSLVIFDLAEGIPESYPHFFETALERRNMLVGLDSKMVKFCPKIFVDEMDYAEDNAAFYFGLMIHFAKTLAKEDDGVVVIVGADLLFGTKHKVFSDRVAGGNVIASKSSNVIPYFSTNSELFNGVDMSETQFWRRFYHILVPLSRSFETVLLPAEVTYRLMDTLHRCDVDVKWKPVCDESLNATNKTIGFNIIVDFDDYRSPFEYLNKIIHTSSENRNETFFKLNETKRLFLFDLDNFAVKAMQRNISHWKNMDISVGFKIKCGRLNKVIDGSLKIPKNQRTSKSRTTTHTNQLFVFEFLINFGTDLNKLDLSYNSYVTNIQRPLSIVSKQIQNIKTQFPVIQTVIMFKEEFSPVLSSNTRACKSSAYCRSCDYKKNTFYDGIITWALARNITIILKPILPISGESSWYQPVQAPPSFQNGVFHFIHYVSRNQPISLKSEKNLCINLNSAPPPKSIALNLNVIGVSVSPYNGFNNVTISSRTTELATLLLFSFHKFNSVVVNLNNESNICDFSSLFRDAVNLDYFQSNILSFNMSGKVYFNLLPLSNSSVKQSNRKCLKSLLVSSVKSVLPNVSIGGVTIPNWNDLEINQNATKDISEYSAIAEKLQIPLGISVEYCEGALRIQMLTNCSYFPHVNYIVCDMSISQASNSNEQLMTSALESMLYISKSFGSVCPHLKVFFRVIATHYLKNDPEISGLTRTTHFLRFSSDLNEFAEQYKIPLFIQMLDTPEHVGWWRLSDLSDPSNPEFYVEKESEYFQNDTWRPTVDDPDTILDQFPYMLVIIIMAAVASVVFITLTVALIALYKSKKYVLTEAEVTEFMNGNGNSDSENMLEESDVLKLKFNSKYEIPKEEFHFSKNLTLLGQGNFGAVYKATIYKLNAAVKTPLAGCTKSIFMSFLAEIKILSYIGNHSNVVEFIGCYTKEIKKGMVYIATELCENGSLYDFLKRISSEQETIDEVSSVVNVRQLQEFSLQIASGMEYLAEKKVIHGDLATRNVLLDKDYVCKLGDFGLARKLYNSTIYNKKGPGFLPYRWLAYESIKRWEFSLASDVWSFGVTLWEIFTLGDIPYADIPDCTELIDQLASGVRLSQPVYSTNLYPMMQECWNMIPTLRPTFSMLKDNICKILTVDYTPVEITDSTEEAPNPIGESLSVSVA